MGHGEVRIILGVMFAVVSDSVFAQNTTTQKPIVNPREVEEVQVQGRPGARTDSQIQDRRFITSGMTRDQVLAKIGKPDSRILNKVTFLWNGVQVTEAYVDTYEPTKGDEQTRTRIRYVADQVESVVREISR